MERDLARTSSNLSFKFDPTQHQRSFRDLGTDFPSKIASSVKTSEKFGPISSKNSLDSEGNEPKTQVNQREMSSLEKGEPIPDSKSLAAPGIWIGAHTSAAGGSYNALYEGREIGASTIQLFTSNQKQWQGRKISSEEVRLWEKAQDETGIREVMSHDSYLINLGSPDLELLNKSRQAFREEIERCHLLNIPYLNFHPGAATDRDESRCIETIAKSLLGYESLLEQGNTRLLLETTAGQGTSIGHRFEQIREIIRHLHKKIPIGVCIDTCHIFAAGYDIRTEEGWEQTLTEFDQVIGLSHLFAFHLNDSQKDLGARVDRHACLGQGKIGLESFRFLMTSPKTRALPKYLETPDGPSGWKKEITQLREFAEITE